MISTASGSSWTRHASVRVVAACALIAGFGSFTGQAIAQVVQNGNFGTTGTTTNLANNGTVATSWTYVNGNAFNRCLIAGDNRTGCTMDNWVDPGLSPNGANYIAIETESASTAGTIEQTIGSLVVGSRYTLMFYVGEENGPITWTVSLGGTTLKTVTDSTAGWNTTPIAVTFTATPSESGGLLAFAASTTSGSPPIALLDGVSIPEPASITLLGLGALGMMGLRRRRVCPAT
jgi:hypothetical protein